ncbi:hypothetical protein [Saccharopolyspora mangrovi]|uniref:Uncharacterized protein n=1 Tax=Saccharopolyspora mangrovi TaxID=3082379 RepID=A0ABU6AIE2_9PSEU|nr:hypothetical protein [Saccharopolyspora sp. S2-29]MEB3371329.1 hypothetical protein [Saccharopolyspora sp. S2-29]
MRNAATASELDRFEFDLVLLGAAAERPDRRTRLPPRREPVPDQYLTIAKPRAALTRSSAVSEAARAQVKTQ